MTIKGLNLHLVFMHTAFQIIAHFQLGHQFQVLSVKMSVIKKKLN
jgi:hypothetical protein